MSIGTVTKLVQSMLLTSPRNGMAYGVIVDADLREVYFSDEAVEGRDGFADLRPGSHVEYDREREPYM